MLAVILFSEILPKTICFLARRRFAPVAAACLAPLARALRPVRGFLMGWLITPLTRLLAPAGNPRGGLTVDEMSALLTLSQKRGLIGDNEGELLQEVLELTDLCAGDVMVPRVDVVAYDLAGSREDLVKLMRERRVNKVPVYTTDLDHVAGVIHAKRLLSEPDAPLPELVEPVKFVPELARLERVLVQFRARGSHLAVVVDEYGGVAGVLTLKDILEEVVGDIVDTRQRRRPPTVRQVGPAEWLVDGDLAIHEWSDAFPTDLHAPRFNTVGGFVISLLGQLPELGQVAHYRNVTFTVEAVQRNRIATLRVRLEEQGP